MKSKVKESFNNGEEIPISVDDNDTIENMFRSEQSAMQNDVKELFHEETVKARTDLSSRQIKLVTKAYLLAKLTGIKDISSILKDFLTLRISDSRQSRKEYVEGLKAKIESDINKGMMNVRGQFGK